MGRKKKQNNEKQSISQENEEEQSSSLSGDIKRSIVAVFLFVLAILLVLGFAGSGALVGKYLSKIVGALLGWGKWLSPFMLIGIGIILLFRKETLFYVSKILGLSSAFLSVLGFFHLYIDDAKMSEFAREGSGGGYIGFAVSFVLLKLTGRVAGTVILFALLLIGIIIAFDFPLVVLIRKFFRKKVAQENIEEEEGEDFELPEEKLEDPVVSETKESEKIEFVKDPNEDEEKVGLIKKAAQKILKKKEKPAEEFVWELPPINLLETTSEKAQAGDTKKNAKIIQDTFKHFGIDVEPGEIQVGPTVTQYSFRPAVGVKLTRITSLSNDLALALAMHPIRIEAPIPGKSMIGIEVPNKTVATVRLPELLESDEYENRQSNLLLGLGKDVSGNLIFGDLKKMPHLLIAGSTGAGKSVCVNAILISMLYQNSPEDLKLILVDPKRVELSLYNGIPHLLSDVIVENSKVISALKWAIGEMERRYKLLPQTGSRDIMSYNQKVEAGETRTVTDPETNETHEEQLEKLPYIVIVIDELADLMASHGKEVEGAIIRLAQMARAVGIHLIVSTQRPSVEVITGLIKANIPTRIAFNVATQIDSRTILDSGGAEKLLRNGDMLFSSAASPGMRRLQGVYVSESEVKRVVDFIINQKKRSGEEEIGEDIAKIADEPKGNKNGEVVTTYTGDRIDFGAISAESNEDDDPLYEEAKKVVMQAGKASASLLQRRLRVGYSRGARLIDMLEDRGIIGPADGAKPRDVLVSAEEGTQYSDDISDQEVRDKWQL